MSYEKDLAAAVNTREEDLAAALLWLRNHYDLGPRGPDAQALKAAVIDRVDRILADGPSISGAMMAAMREKYPRSPPETD